MDAHFCRDNQEAFARGSCSNKKRARCWFNQNASRSIFLTGLVSPAAVPPGVPTKSWPANHADRCNNDRTRHNHDWAPVGITTTISATVLATAATVGGLLPQGELVTIGVTPEPLGISPLQLITPGLSIVGHPSGTAKEIEDTMQFAVLSGVRAWIEELPLAQAAEGYAALEQGRAHYRTVLTM